MQPVRWWFPGIILLTWSAVARGDGPPVLMAPAVEAVRAPGAGGGSAPVTLDRAVLGDLAAGRLTRAAVRLPSGRLALMKVRQVREAGSGGRTIAGMFEDDSGYAVLLDGPSACGVVHVNGEGDFELAAQPDGTHLWQPAVAAERGCTQMPMEEALAGGPEALKRPGAETLEGDGPAGPLAPGNCPYAKSPLAGYLADDGSTVDVMVYYTPQAVSQAGSVATLESRIDIATATANMLFANSNIPLQVRIIRKAPIAYTENGTGTVDLVRLTETADGWIDHVHPERDTYGADIVSLWVRDLGDGGQAFLGYAEAPLDDGRYGFMVMRQDNYAFETFGHELGHNLGCQHDRANMNGPGFYAYSHGYRQPCTQPCTPNKTVMAYPPGTTVPYFSSPDVMYAGQPLGGLDEFGLPCDNRLTILNLKFTVANYRPSTVTPAPPSRLYVAAAAPGGSGTSWGTAINDLQKALGLAVRSRGAVQEIWVKQGTYRPDLGTGDRQFWFRLVSGVAVYGGFAGTETSLNQRDPAAHPVILSGDLGVPADAADNSLHVVNGNDISATARLDGVQVRYGNADGMYDPDATGGGMLNRCGHATIVNTVFMNNQAGFGGAVHNGEGSGPTFSGCRFENNEATTAAGGMLNDNSSPMVSGCAFATNLAPNSGAMENRSGSVPTVADCTFTGNVANWGGAVSNFTASPTFTDCTFTGNISANGGGGMINGESASPALTRCDFDLNDAAFGGGVYNHTLSNPQVTDCAFTENTAVSGAGMYNYNASPTVSSCDFVMNHAGNTGGGLYNVVGSSPRIEGCLFDRNESDYLAGGLANSASPAKVIRCDFVGNTAYYGGGGWESAGGATYLNCGFFGNEAQWGGGGLEIGDGNTPLLVNTVFSGNRVPDGDGGGVRYGFDAAFAMVNCTVSGNMAAYNGGGISGNTTNPTLTNTLLWGNSDFTGTTQAGQFYRYSGAPVFSHCGVQGWTGSLGGTSNNGSNPTFADANGADNLTGTPDDDLTPTAAAAIDTGLASALPADTEDLDGDGNTAEPIALDYSGQPRLLGPAVDRGAVEAVPAIPGDFDGDGDVDGDDAVVLRSCATRDKVPQNAPGCIDARLDADTDVDQTDFAIFQRCVSGPGQAGDPACAG